MMEQDLKKLRHKQILIQNILYVLGIVLVMIFLIFERSLKAFSFLAGAICLCSFIIGLTTRKRGELIGIIVPSMKTLFDYERDKLGIEYKKLKRRQLVSLAILTPIMFFQGIITPSNSPMAPGKSVLYYFIPMSVLMFAMLNISSYFHIKKVDKSNTEELKGYANRTWLKGIFIGIALSGLLFAVAIVSVFFILNR